MRTHCWVLSLLRIWDLPSSRPPSKAVKCVLRALELTGLAFPVAYLTGEGREGSRGAEQEERVQETRGSRGMEAESSERGKSNSGLSCTWKRTGTAGTCCIGVAGGIGTGHCLLLQGSWGLGCQIFVQAPDVGLGHKGETFQLLEPCRVFLLFLQEENVQQEPLEKKREDEVKERGKTVLELKNLLEQKQLGQVKERCELVPALEKGIGHGCGEAVGVNVMLHLGSGAAWRLGSRSRRP